ncbi:DUF1772 domain-containing protein [Maribacter algarum]|uniref:DUF1772 domain-containing protein n=1 Tax=Maribacter algarum (ex Zhang et al. 2020) TaxID=2578118 RepID=A0A5S3PGU5_9FLAO|nr:anthrone oxygenase family protein [Maribacter algarum]TMM53326.1 DUF1772 domain-containing protein [Maribacter algarum]
MKAQSIILILATLSTGVMAGLFFTWSNTVTSGIGRLSDVEYLRSFQAMNRTILNPAFFLAIFGAAVLLPLSSFLHLRLKPQNLFWMLLIASLLYLIGVIIVTFVGNIPLNTILDKTQLNDISLEDAKTLRESFENKWNLLNWIRTYSALAAFILLIICSITSKI